MTNTTLVSSYHSVAVTHIRYGVVAYHEPVACCVVIGANLLVGERAGRHSPVSAVFRAVSIFQLKVDVLILIISVKYSGVVACLSGFKRGACVSLVVKFVKL